MAEAQSLAPLSLAGDVRRRDRDRFVTALFAPPEAQDALFALYSFNQELAAVAGKVREPLIGEMRLQWWRDLLDRLERGEHVAHPAAQGLGAAMAKWKLTRHHIERLIDAREADLDPAPPATRADMLAYAEGSAAPLISLALEVVEVRGQVALAAAHAAGTAWALTGLLRATPFHAAEGRVTLAADLLEAHGVDPDRLVAGKPGPGLAGVAREMAGIVSTHIAEARRLLPELPKRAVSPLLVVALAETYLRRLDHAGFDAMDTGWSRVRPPVLRLWWMARRGRY